MDNKYSKNQLEEIYNCTIFKDTGFDDHHQFWTAHGQPIDENIREEIDGTCISFAKG